MLLYFLLSVLLFSVFKRVLIFVSVIFYTAIRLVIYVLFIFLDNYVLHTFMISTHYIYSCYLSFC